MANGRKILSVQSGTFITSAAGALTGGSVHCDPETTAGGPARRRLGAGIRIHFPIHTIAIEAVAWLSLFIHSMATFAVFVEETTIAAARQATRRTFHSDSNARRRFRPLFAASIGRAIDRVSRPPARAPRAPAPIPSPPIGSRAAAALPTGMMGECGHFRTAKRGSGAASQGPTRRARDSLFASERFSPSSSANNASRSP